MFFIDLYKEQKKVAQTLEQKVKKAESIAENLMKEHQGTASSR